MPPPRGGVQAGSVVCGDHPKNQMPWPTPARTVASVASFAAAVVAVQLNQYRNTLVSCRRYWMRSKGEMVGRLSWGLRAASRESANQV